MCYSVGWVATKVRQTGIIVCCGTAGAAADLHTGLVFANDPEDWLTRA